jgi:hypothetical protein
VAHALGYGLIGGDGCTQLGLFSLFECRYTVKGRVALSTIRLSQIHAHNDLFILFISKALSKLASAQLKKMAELTKCALSWPQKRRQS